MARRHATPARGTIMYKYHAQYGNRAIAEWAVSILTLHQFCELNTRKQDNHSNGCRYAAVHCVFAVSRPRGSDPGGSGGRGSCQTRGRTHKAAQTHFRKATQLAVVVQCAGAESIVKTTSLMICLLHESRYKCCDITLLCLSRASHLRYTNSFQTISVTMS